MILRTGTAGTFAQDRLECYHDHSPVWDAVGQHMHFAPPLLDLARRMLHRALGVPERSPTPLVRHFSSSSPSHLSLTDAGSSSRCTSGTATLRSGARAG
jgi:hypothetical protein